MAQNLTSAQRRKLRRDPEVIARSARIAADRKEKLKLGKTTSPKLSEASDNRALLEWTDKACSDAKSGYFNKVPDDILSFLKNGHSIRISCNVGRTWLDIQASGITREFVGECERFSPTGLKCLFGTCGGKLYSAWTNASQHGVTRVR